MTLAEGGFTGPDDPSAAPPVRTHPYDQFISAEQVRVAGELAMGSIREQLTGSPTGSRRNPRTPGGS